MSVSNFIPTIWHDTTLDKYEEKAVFRPLMNYDYDKDVINFGDAIKVNSLNDFDDAAYSGSVTYTDLDDASLTILVNQDRYVAKQLDDVDSAQTNPKLMGKIAGGIADAFLRTQEAYIAALYTDAGIVIGGTTDVTAITSANVISEIGDIATSMDENDVPDDNRVAVVPPWLATKMGLSKIIRATENSKELSAGYVGEFMGFDVYKSNRISHSSTTWYAPMFFRRGDTLGLVEQLNEMEALRLESKIGDGLRALMIYGAKVIRPESLAVAYFSEGSESAI